MSLSHRSRFGAVAAVLALCAAAPVIAQSPPAFVSKTLQQVPLGELPPGKWDIKATMLSIAPGGEVPFHVHKGPGLRYVLEGAVSINWKDGKTQTYAAGSTYFEGSGANHPPGNFAARNSGAVPCRVVIIELTP